jgi:hypothetical protein
VCFQTLYRVKRDGRHFLTGIVSNTQIAQAGAVTGVTLTQAVSFRQLKHVFAVSWQLVVVLSSHWKLLRSSSAPFSRHGFL